MKPKCILRVVRVLTLGPVVLAFVGCSSGSSTNNPPEPAFKAATFSAPIHIDNQFLPLTTGTTRVYQAVTDEGVETIVVEVLGSTKTVAGVNCVVVRDRAYLEDLLMEDTHDWFAQDDRTNVWYMGEDVINYAYDDEGNLLGSDSDGAWEAGLDVAGIGAVAEAGIIMKSVLKPGDSYRQEFYKGEAEDMGEIVATGVDMTLGDGTRYSCLQTRDWSNLDPGVEEHKYYAPDVGLIKEEAVGGDEVVEIKGTFATGREQVPDFDAASFSDPTRIDNPYLPLVPGNTKIFKAETDEGSETILIEVLDTTRVVNGIECVVYRDRVYLDDVLIEDTYDWFAQDDAGNVWYMGEIVVNYRYDDEGNLLGTDNEGAWEAGVNGALPGIQMWADPVSGESYYQEYLKGKAEDMAMVVATGVTVDLANGARYENCLQVLDWVPLTPHALEYKYYAPSVGFVKETSAVGDEAVELVESGQ